MVVLELRGTGGWEGCGQHAVVMAGFWGREGIGQGRSKLGASVCVRCFGKEGWEYSHGRLLFQACLFNKVFLLMVFRGVLSRNDGLVLVSITSIAQR